MNSSRILLPVAIALSLVALGGVALVASLYLRQMHDMQSEVAALRTQVAALTLANEAAARGGAIPAATPGVDNSAQLTDLANRLAILEQNWRSPQALPSIDLPVTTGAASDAAPAADGSDCIPVGTRFLATPGEPFPVCGEDVSIELAAIGVTDVVLSTGKTAPVGVATVLGDTNCTVTVLSADGASGFAELRVGCM